MARIFERSVNSSEKVIEALPQEMIVMSLGKADWTECHVGICPSVNRDQDTEATSFFNLSFSTLGDHKKKYLFGLKSRANLAFPGAIEGENFCGFLANTNARIRNDNVSNINDNNGVFAENYWQTGNAGVLGSIINNVAVGVANYKTASGINTSNDWNRLYHNANCSTSNASGQLGLSFVVENRGRSNQQIRIWMALRGNSSTWSLAQARTIAFSNNRNCGAYQWNENGKPLPLPEAFIFYLPYSNVRLRLHAVFIAAF